MHNIATFHQSVKRLRRYRNFPSFSRWRPSAILDFFFTLLDHPRCIFGGLYCYAKFDWNPCRSFRDMTVWIFCTFGFKMPIHAPKAMRPQSQNCPFPLDTRGHPSNIPIPPLTPFTTQNDSSIDSRPSAQLRNKVPIGYNEMHQIHRQNCLFPFNDIHPYSTLILDRPHSLPQTASGSTQPFC